MARSTRGSTPWPNSWPKPRCRPTLDEALAAIYDLERLVARVTTGRASPRDLSFIARTLAVLPPAQSQAHGPAQCAAVPLGSGASILCPDVRGQLEAALADDCPLVSREGGFIRAGFQRDSTPCATWPAAASSGLPAIRPRRRPRTGIANLKVGFNKVFGYYLEITNAQSAKIPPEYIRKQTVKNAERYITPELKEYEEKVLAADEQSQDAGIRVVFGTPRSGGRRRPGGCGRPPRRWPSSTCWPALADQARQRNYCRPTIVDEPLLEIVDGRHPVLDALMPDGSFVPNDVVGRAASRQRFC